MFRPAVTCVTTQWVYAHGISTGYSTVTLSKAAFLTSSTGNERMTARLPLSTYCSKCACSLGHFLADIGASQCTRGKRGL
eukprot:6140441-Alexandrium_andersonii.AAC.1